MKRVVFVAIAVGCGLSEEEYSERSFDVRCAKWEECLGDDFDADVFGCTGRSSEDESESSGVVTCDFDASLAADCLDQTLAAECDDEDFGFTLPEVCGEVYSNCS